MRRNEYLKTELQNQVRNLVQAKEEQMKTLVEDVVTNSTWSVERVFHEELREMTLRLLGFNTRFGEIEIDHCNGRNTVAAEQVSFQLRDKAIELMKALDLDKLISLQEDLLKKAIVEEIEQQARYIISELIENKIRDKVVKKLSLVVDEVLTDELVKETVDRHVRGKTEDLDEYSRDLFA